jgi:hypothetical protein
MSNVNTSVILARDAQIIVGIQKHLQTPSSLPLAGSTYTPADLVKVVQSQIDQAGVVANAAAAWHAAVATQKALNAKLSPILRGLRQYVLNVYGPESPVLADFGFTPPKKRVVSPQTKVAAATKAKATRKARSTMGKVQKKGVKGDVTGITVTPTTANAPPVAAGSPPTAGSPAATGSSTVTSSPPTGATSPVHGS